MGAESLPELREKEYLKRLEVSRLRRLVHEPPRASAVTSEARAALAKAEAELLDIETARAKAQQGGVFIDTEKKQGTLGAETTGLEAQATLRMTHVPTAICHLLTREETPLVTCRVRNAHANDNKRVRVISFVDGYSAQAVDTVELSSKKEYTFDQLPTFFPDRLKRIHEVTRATLNVMVEDIDGKVELHKTTPLWLLPRTTAPLDMIDPKTGQWVNLSRYLAAFVTPNAPSVMTFLRSVAARHPSGRLAGYQDGAADVRLQAKATYDALTEAGIAYVDSIVAYGADEASANQRVRLPRHTLRDTAANCIDGAVLFASLLEAASLSAALVLTRSHAFAAWETTPNSNAWEYVETTKVATQSFDDARSDATANAEAFRAAAEETTDPGKKARLFQVLALRQLRAKHGIMPME